MDSSRWPTLDADLVSLVDGLPEPVSPLEDIDASRRRMAELASKAEVSDDERLDVTDVEPAELPPMRIYRPSDASDRRPGLLYIHGGGFCMGSVQLEHHAAAQLARSLDSVVVSVAYRLAPEHPYPAGLEDCYAALGYLAGLDIVDPRLLGVHGQSAGGGLAAAVALLARDRGGPRLVVQSLGSPQLDDRLETPSMRAFTETPMWTRQQAAQSWGLYLDGKPADGYAAPARADDLAGLPPTYLTTMELDPLRDEGIGYAMRLLAAGVSVELHNYPGTFHGSAVAADAAISRRAAADLVAALSARLHPAAAEV